MTNSADLDDLNDYNRHLYRQEVSGLVERLNTFLRPGEKKFYTPDIKFNRSIGRWAGKHVPLARPAKSSTKEHTRNTLPSACPAPKTRSCFSI